ncbi:MAG: hypothetical protein EB075_00830, partial [Bacteroidetes bacterium]|nr:hypothetical protein [Bacteroidota bacterium]
MKRFVLKPEPLAAPAATTVDYEQALNQAQFRAAVAPPGKHLVIAGAAISEAVLDHRALGAGDAEEIRCAPISEEILLELPGRCALADRGEVEDQKPWQGRHSASSHAAGVASYPASTTAAST